MIVVGGVIPPGDFDALMKAGPSAIFPPGTVIADAAGKLNRELNGRLGLRAEAGGGVEGEHGDGPAGRSAPNHEGQPGRPRRHASGSVRIARPRRCETRQRSGPADRCRPRWKFSLLDPVDVERELADRTGLPVSLVMRRSLDPAFQDSIAADLAEIF
jgi:hypothetical protein